MNANLNNMNNTNMHTHTIINTNDILNTGMNVHTNTNKDTNKNENTVVAVRGLMQRRGHMWDKGPKQRQEKNASCVVALPLRTSVPFIRELQELRNAHGAHEMLTELALMEVSRLSSAVDAPGSAGRYRCCHPDAERGYRCRWGQAEGRAEYRSPCSDERPAPPR